jgi:hypothetical protein
MVNILLRFSLGSAIATLCFIGMGIVNGFNKQMNLWVMFGTWAICLTVVYAVKRHARIY